MEFFFQLQILTAIIFKLLYDLSCGILRRGVLHHTNRKQFFFGVTKFGIRKLRKSHFQLGSFGEEFVMFS